MATGIPSRIAPSAITPALRAFSRPGMETCSNAIMRTALRALKMRKGPANGNWHSFPHCPFCNHAGSASVFKTRHGDLFKCHHANCPSGTQDEKGAWDEIGFLGYELGLNRREAALVWLKEAGLEPIAP